MKKPLLFLSLACLVACSSESKPVPRTTDISTDKLSASTVMPLQYGTTTKKTIQFEESYFESPASQYSKELALYALGGTVAALTKDTIKTFYDDLGFENAFYSGTYDTGHEILHAQYSFAARKMNGFYLINMSINGFEYHVEFVDNVNLGETGNHYAYQTVANTILKDFAQYMKSYDAYKVKIFVEGYSRTAAIAELVGASLTDQNDFEASADDIFVYSFEAPTAFENPKTYTNIHHIINSDDYVPQFFPKAYGLQYAGVLHDIYLDDIGSYVKQEFPEMTFESYKGNDDYPRFKSVLDEVVSWMPEDYSSKEGSVSVRNRKEYVDILQEPLMYFVAIFTGSPIDVLDLDFSTLDLDVLSMVGSEHGFIEGLKTIADAVQGTYDNAEFEKQAKRLFAFSSTVISKHLIDVMTLKDLFTNNTSSVKYIHYPWVTYSLLAHQQ